jgi:hypothetical protein
MTKHATLQKKGTTSSKGNIMLDPILATKGRNGPSLTTSLNDQIGKRGRKGNKGQS